MINCRQSEFPRKQKRIKKIEWKRTLKHWGEGDGEGKNPKALTNPSIMSASSFCALHSSRTENVFMVSELACENFISRLFHSRRNIAYAESWTKDPLAAILHGHSTQQNAFVRGRQESEAIHSHSSLIITSRYLSALNVSALQLCFSLFILIFRSLRESQRRNINCSRQMT